MLRIAALGLGLSACAEEAPDTAEGLASDTPQTLTGPVQVVLKESRLLGAPEDFAHVWTMGVIDDEYLLLGDDESDHPLMVLDIENGKVVSRFGAYGDGPYEFRQPFRITQDPERPDTWWVYDFMAWKWTPVTMQGDVTRWTVGERYSLRGAPPAPETPIWVGENKAVVHGMFRGFAVAQVMFTADRQHVSDWSPVEYPQPYTREDMPQETGLMFLNRSYVAVRPSGGRFALAYQFDTGSRCATETARSFARWKVPEKPRPAIVLTPPVVSIGRTTTSPAT